MDTTPDLDQFTSRRSTMYATRGVVATSQPSRCGGRCRNVAGRRKRVRRGGFDRRGVKRRRTDLDRPRRGRVRALSNRRRRDRRASKLRGAHRRRRRSTTFAGGSPTTRTSIPTTRHARVRPADGNRPRNGSRLGADRRGTRRTEPRARSSRRSSTRPRGSPSRRSSPSSGPRRPTFCAGTMRGRRTSPTVAHRPLASASASPARRDDAAYR